MDKNGRLLFGEEVTKEQARKDEIRGTYFISGLLVVGCIIFLAFISLILKDFMVVLYFFVPFVVFLLVFNIVIHFKSFGGYPRSILLYENGIFDMRKQMFYEYSKIRGEVSYRGFKTSYKLSPLGCLNFEYENRFVRIEHFDNRIQLNESVFLNIIENSSGKKVKNEKKGLVAF